MVFSFDESIFHEFKKVYTFLFFYFFLFPVSLYFFHEFFLFQNGYLEDMRKDTEPFLYFLFFSLLLLYSFKVLKTNENLFRYQLFQLLLLLFFPFSNIHQYGNSFQLL